MSFRAPMIRAVARRAQGSSVQSLRNPVIRRRFASEAPQPSSSSSTPLLVGGGLAALGAAYFFFGRDATPAEAVEEAKSVAKGAETAVENRLGLGKKHEDFQKVYQRIAEVLDHEEYDDGSLAPVFIRLAWHSSGTYNKEDGTGGSNYATMRFKPEATHGANNGLDIARGHMEKIKQEFPWISYGDLWTLGGVAAVQECGGPVVPWRPGRIDGFEHHVTPDGRLPDASQAQDHLRFIFYRMGFNDQEIVALSGAHAMGRCHTDRSGFEGPWTFSPVTFSNQYFTLLKDEPWQWRKWKGPAQYEDKKTKTLMMLPTDMALVKDKSFKKYVDIYAKDEEAFFKDFSAVFAKLLELGVPTAQFPGDAWKMGSA